MDFVFTISLYCYSKKAALFPLLVSLLLLPSLGFAADPSMTTNGLASKYPGDVGIGNHRAVIFVENFEEGSIEQLKSRWETVTHPEDFSFSTDIPSFSSGSHSLLMTHAAGKGTGPQLYRRLSSAETSKTEKSKDQTVFARFYVKFDPDCGPLHHFGASIGGNHPNTPWPLGGAGERPGGDKRFIVDIEPFGTKWTWDYYTYWGEMRGSPPRGQTWGNCFINDPKLKVARGEWTCLEVMVKLNEVGKSNGELALWINGNQVSHLGPGFPKGKWTYDKFIPGGDGDAIRWSDAAAGPEHFTVAKGGEPFEGFRWRTIEDLTVNFLWVYVYITDAPAGHVSRIWFDEIVVATEYIGPQVRAAK